MSDTSQFEEFMLHSEMKEYIGDVLFSGKYFSSSADLSLKAFDSMFLLPSYFLVNYKQKIWKMPFGPFLLKSFTS